jgi:diguanylate cyclase (GGDEF)-like protein
MNSVRTRILFFFTLFAVASCVAVYMGMLNTQAVANAANTVVTNHLPIVVALEEMDVSLQRQDNAVYRYIASGNKMWLDECEKERVNYNQFFLIARTHASVEEEQIKLDQIDELYIQYDNEVRHILLSKDRFSGPVQKMLARADQYLRQIQSMVDQVESLRQGMTIVHRDSIISTVSRHKRFAFYFLFTIILLFVLLAIYLVHYLVRPLSLLLEGIRDFTRGKTDVVVPPVGKDELGELQEAFNEMSRELAVERKRLRAESQSDALTGLFNMRYFKRQLVDEFSRSQRYGRTLTLLMIDVDHFKSYNDRNGHPAGDIVLKEISRILIRNVRGTDIVGRYGGEEFVILLPETSMESALHVAEKINKTVADHHFPFRDNQESEKLSVSIGVASYPDTKITSDQDLIESSDKALYLAKKLGRNRVCVFLKGDLMSLPDYEIARVQAPVQS